MRATLGCHAPTRLVLDDRDNQVRVKRRKVQHSPQPNEPFALFWPEYGALQLLGSANGQKPARVRWAGDRLIDALRQSLPDAFARGR